MQARAVYDDVVRRGGALSSRERAASGAGGAGIAAERIVLDPGFGFGKTPEHNLELLRRQRELLALGRPLLVGWSRKSTLGTLTGRAVGERLAASVARRAGRRRSAARASCACTTSRRRSTR